MTRGLWGRMIALALVVLLGTFYILIEVMGYRIGAQQFPVMVRAADAGGVYKGAAVTYRGVPVGQVTSLGLRPDGVDIHVAIDPGTRIPANADAHVKELSALGEQYLDLVPSGPDPVLLRAGSVIPADRVTLPVPIGSALLDLGSLLTSVNARDLRTVEDFLISGFTGTGPDLRTIVVTGQDLFQALVAAQAGTQQLIVDGQPVLRSFQSTDDQFATFAHGLDQITGQLAASNQDLQALIRNGQAAESQLTPFLSANSSSIESTIASLGASSAVTEQYQPSLSLLFQVLPVVSGQLARSAGNGQVNGLLTINTANTVCPYVPADQVPSPTQAVGAPALTNTCSTAAPDLLQRGAHTAQGG